MPAELLLLVQRDKLIVKIGTIDKEAPHEKLTDHFLPHDPATWHPHDHPFANRRGYKTSIRKYTKYMRLLMDTFLTFGLGLLLRIGIPVGISVLIFFLLRQLDNRWQKEAQAIPVIPSQRPCWEIKGCSEQARKDCPAASQAKLPCWQLFRTKNGLLREECLGCDVFHLAPSPVQP
jgi:hypothetical protein